MKILVAGSLRHLEGEQLQQARLACRQIGHALVEAGHDIVVGSASENTTDYHVLHGAREAAATARGPLGDAATGPQVHIHVVRPDEYRAERFDKLRKDPAFDVRMDTAGRGWWSERSRQVRAADGVLLVGGAGGTRSIAVIADDLGRPILPIPRFGGAAAEIGPRLQGVWRRLGADERRRLSDLWDGQSAKLAIAVLTRAIGSIETPESSPSERSRPGPVERDTSLPTWLEVQISKYAPRALKLIAAFYSLAIFVAGVIASKLIEDWLDRP
jgi:hypothetical protein